MTPSNGEFLLTRPLNYVNSGGVLEGTLLTGTRIRVSSYSATGNSFPYMIQVWQVLKPGQTDWEALIPGLYGFVDLDFESGTLPNDRTLITDYYSEEIA
jgi:hypothetical protein